MNDMHDDNALIHKAIGHAMTTWNIAEDRLYRIFLLHMQAPDALMAMACLGAVVSLRGKLDVIRATLERSFRGHPESMKAWNKLSARVTDLSKTRNTIAHGLVVHVQGANAATMPEGVCLMPFGMNLYNKMKGDLDKALESAMSVEDIGSAALEFLALEEALEAFEEDHPPRRQ